MFGFSNPRYSEDPREHQKQQIMANLDRAKDPYIKLEDMQADGMNLQESAPDIVGMARQLPMYKDIHWEAMDKDGLSPQQQLQVVAMRNDHIKQGNFKLEKEKERVQYDAPTGTGDARLDDFVLGMHKAYVGAVRTVEDIGHFSTLLSDKEYEHLNEEHIKKLELIEEAIRDKSFFSMETLGELAPTLALAPTSLTAVGTKMLTQGITRKLMGTALIAAEQGSLSYILNRGDSESDTTSATTAAITGAALGSTISHIPSLVGYIGKVFGSNPKEALDFYMQKFHLTENDILEKTAEAEAAFTFKEGVAVEDKMLWTIFNSTRAGREEVKSIMAAGTMDGERIASNYMGILKGVKDSMNVMMKGRGKYKTKAMHEATVDTLKVLRKADKAVSKEFSRLHNIMDSETSIAIRNDGMKEVLETTGKVEKLKRENKTTGITNSKEIAIKRKEIAKVKELRLEAKDKLVGLAKDDPDYETLQTQVASYTRDIEDKTIKLDRYKSHADIAKAGRNKNLDKLQADVKELETKYTKYKMPTGEEAPFEKELAGHLSTVRGLLQQPEVTTGEAVRAVISVNKLMRIGAGKEGSLHHTLGEIKKYFNSGIEDAMRAEGKMDILGEWQDVNSQYMHMAKFSETALKESIDSLASLKLDDSRVAKFVQDLPALLGKTHDEAYAHLEGFISGRKLIKLERAMFSMVLNGEHDATAFNPLVKATARIRPVSKMGKKIDDANIRIAKLLGDTEKMYGNVMMKLNDQGQQSSIGNKIMALLIVKKLWHSMLRLSKGGRALTHGNKLLGSGHIIDKVNRIEAMVEKMDKGNLDRILEELKPEYDSIVKQVFTSPQATTAMTQGAQQ